MYKIAICDDDECFVKKMVDCIRIFSEREKLKITVYECLTAQKLLFKINDNEYFDIFLLDIEMPQISGLDLAAKIRSIYSNSIVIFVSSHTKYAPESFELSVFRYIPKELMMDKIFKALLDAFNLIKLQKNKYYMIDTSKKNVRLLHKDIVYIYKSSKYSTFELISEGKRNTESVRKTINQVYQELDSDEFVFIERGCLVNIANIEKVIGNKIYLINGDDLKIAETHLAKVKNCISAFWRKLM